MFGFITDAIKHAHDQTIGRGLDMWQTNYMDRKIQNRTAELNRQLWEYQMNNAYQLTVDDMRKAGLNPIMAFGQGATSASGHASGASGYSGSKQSNWMPSQSLVASKQLSQMDSQIGKTNAEKDLLFAQLESAKAQASIDKAVAKVWSKNPWVARAQVANTIAPKSFAQIVSMLGGFGTLEVSNARGQRDVERAVEETYERWSNQQRGYEKHYKDSR